MIELACLTDMGNATPIEADHRLTAAEAELRRERRRTTDEFEALELFEERVREIRTEQNTTSNRNMVALVSTATTPGGLERVRDAYVETLMSAPHYLEEYDDSYVDSLAEEFAPELAAALTNGSEFNERCKRSLLSAVSNAQSARESLLESIDQERESIRKVRADLEPLFEECEDFRSTEFDRLRFGTLDAYRARLEAIADRVENSSTSRQNALFDQRRAQNLPADVPDVAVYFYQDIEVDYPVMSVIADLLERIRTLRTQIERAMSTCYS